jgi:hypothetical protein
MVLLTHLKAEFEKRLTHVGIGTAVDDALKALLVARLAAAIQTLLPPLYSSTLAADKLFYDA